MASATMTPGRFGNSFPGNRDNYSATTLTMAETLPSIDFGFNDLRERMAQFTARFDEFIERGRKRVLEERNAFRINVAELEEVQRTKKTAIVELESKSSNHAQNLAKEAAETEEMHEVIHALTQRREEHVSRRDHLKADVAGIQSAIRQKKEAQAVHHRALEAQARHNIPELSFWEHCLGLRIEGSGYGAEDQLRFVFVCVDERDEDKEAWFELNMSSGEYEVKETKPKLETEGLDGLVEKLNENRELGTFLKSVRALFVEVMKV